MSKTRKFITRKTRAEVAPELPVIDRQFSFHELSKEVEALYRAALEEFLDADEEGGNAFENNILAYLSKMRTSCRSVPDRFMHRSCDGIPWFNRSQVSNLRTSQGMSPDILQLKLSRLMLELQLGLPLNLNSGLSPDARAGMVEDFRSPENKILIASTLASGEGLNLQFCSDCIMLERQWNPANEEQAESRFIRIGQLAQSVTATYFVAVGTVVEFFSEIVERKREIVNSVLNGEEAATPWDQTSLMKELSEVLREKGGKRWGWR